MGYNMFAEYAEVLMKVHFKWNSACFLDCLFQEKKKKQNKTKKGLLRRFLMGISIFSYADNSVFLLYAEKTAIRAISIESNITKEQMIPVSDCIIAVGVDFSFEERMVFWSDVGADTISRVFLNGSGHQTVVSGGNVSNFPVNYFCKLWK